MESLSILNQVSEIELIYRSKVKASERPKVSTATDAYKLFLQHWDKNKIGFIEQFKTMFLNRSNRVLGIYEVSTGGIAGTFVDPKLVFTAALKSNASAIVLCHNHPSGKVTPSYADKQLTEKLVAGGCFLDLQVAEHLIISEEGFFSFAEEGLL